jgi:hypothetical protein
LIPHSQRFYCFILVLFLILFYTALRSTESHAFDRTDDLRKEIEALNSIRKVYQSREEDLSQKRKKLAAEVQRLKRNGNFLDDIRLGWKLRLLRDLLSQEVELEREQSEIRTSIFLKRKELQEEILAKADRLLETAKIAYQADRIGEAEDRYLEILALLQEHQSLTALIQEDGPSLGDRGILQLPVSGMVTGYESPHELREVADIFMVHYDQMGKGILELEYRRLEVVRELMLRKNLQRFQGIIDRSPLEKEPGIREGNGAQSAGDEIRSTEKRLSDIDLRLKDQRRLRKELLESARGLQEAADIKERELRGENR